MRHENSGQTSPEVARRITNLLDCPGIDPAVQVNYRTGNVRQRFADITLASRVGAGLASPGPTV